MLANVADEMSEPERTEELLDGIPGAFERAALGARQANEGNVVAVDELSQDRDGVQPSD
jgi:hypothetical protein